MAMEDGDVAEGTGMSQRKIIIIRIVMLVALLILAVWIGTILPFAGGIKEKKALQEELTSMQASYSQLKLDYDSLKSQNPDLASISIPICTSTPN